VCLTSFRALPAAGESAKQIIGRGSEQTGLVVSEEVTNILRSA
jgi:hypothetical protein